MNYNIKNWPFRWFGFWKEYGTAYSNYPTVSNFIDKETNDSYKKDELLRYLRNGVVLATTSRVALPSPVDGKTGEVTLSAMTDGHWIWLDSICELIEYNHLVIPEAFYKWITGHNFYIQEVTDVQLEKLEWPSL